MSPLLRVMVYDWDRFSKDDQLGWASVDISAFPYHRSIELTLPLRDVDTGTVTIKLNKSLRTDVIEITELDREDRIDLFAKRANQMWCELRQDLSSLVNRRRKLKKIVRSQLSRVQKAAQLAVRLKRAADLRTAASRATLPHVGSPEPPLESNDGSAKPGRANHSPLQ